MVVGIPILLFSAGQDLFGSDRGTIDSYNQDVLDSCPLPDGSTLVQVSVGPQLDQTGGRYWGMSYVYASPSSPDEVAGFFGVDVGQATLVSPQRACQYEQRPSVLVQPVPSTSVPTTAPPDDEIVPDSDSSSADDTVDVRMIAEVPSGTQTLFRLHVQQREANGIF